MPENNQTAPTGLHSADYFTSARDFWWNQDFLRLLAERWRLGSARSLADIGCGIGHWSRLLFPHLCARCPDYRDRSRAGVDRAGSFGLQQPIATGAG